jgi:hypothetical protein
VPASCGPRGAHRPMAPVVRRAGAPGRGLGSAGLGFGLGLAVEGQEAFLQAGLLDRDVDHRQLQQPAQPRHQLIGRDQQPQLVPGPGWRPVRLYRRLAVVIAVGEAEPDPSGPCLTQGRDRFTVTNQPPATDDRHTLAGPLHLRQDMAGQKHGPARLAGLADQGEEGLLDQRVQPLGRLVQDHHRRVMLQRLHKPDLLPHAVGVLRHRTEGPVRSTPTAGTTPRVAGSTCPATHPATPGAGRRSTPRTGATPPADSRSGG